MTQLFKNLYPKEDFLCFLKKHCTFDEKNILFSKESFKKIKLAKEAQPFFDNLRDYYFISKKKYVERNPTYKYFITVLKQIARSHHITYTSKINYSKSTYNLEYLFLYNHV